MSRAELRKLAEAANADAVQGATYERDWLLSSRSLGQFVRAINPDEMLGLLDDLAWAEARLAAVVAVHGRYFDMDGRPGFDDTDPAPEDVWRYDRDFRAACELWVRP